MEVSVTWNQHLPQHVEKELLVDKLCSVYFDTACSKEKKKIKAKWTSFTGKQMRYNRIPRAFAFFKMAEKNQGLSRTAILNIVKTWGRGLKRNTSETTTHVILFVFFCKEGYFIQSSRVTRCWCSSNAS